MAVVKNLMVRAGADFSALKKATQETQKTLSGFQKSVSNTMKGVAFILTTFSIGKLIKDSVQSAMEIEAAIQQIKRIMGESSNQFLKWADSSALAFNMGKQDAIKYGAVYSNLVSGFTKNTAETMNYTESLLKASSIIASSTGRSMEDVMERIRSGLLGNTEAIEDLGVNVNVAMIQSTEAFKKFANGKSWQQLDYQTQSQIRLMAILEQTSKKYGDTVNQNTASSQQRFIAILKNVQLSLGQAFLPIYQAVLPALTSMAQGLANAMNIFAQFMQALFGKTQQASSQAKATNQQASAVNNLGNAYKEAGKNAKGALAGFDEINSLSKNPGGVGTDTGSSGTQTSGGGNSDLGNAAVDVSSKVQDMANKVKKAFSDVASFINKNKVIITSAISAIVSGFAAFKIISNWAEIIKILNVAIEALSAVMSGISLPILAAAAAIALVVGNIVYLWQTNDGFRNSVIEVWNNIKDFLTKIVTDMWSIIKGIWDKYGSDLINNLSGFMKSIQNLIISVWEGYTKPFITNALEMLSWLWDKHLKGLVQQVGEFIMKLVNGVLELWNGFFAPIINWLVVVLGPIYTVVISNMVDLFGSTIAAIIDIAKGLIRGLGGIIDFIVGIFTGNWAKAWQGVVDIFGGIFDSLVGLVKYPLNLIIDAINTVLRGVDLVSGVFNDIPGINIKATHKIPKLAQGGITNGAMLAMVGDNPGGREVVSPLSDLEDIVANAVRSASPSGSNVAPNIFVTLQMGDSNIEFGRASINAINKAQRVAGTTLLNV